MAERYSEDEWRRLNEELKNAVLRGYPNPDRIGCPGTEILRRLAAHQLPVDDPAYTHVMECSPCYQELLEIRATMPAASSGRSSTPSIQSSKAKWIWATAGIAGALILAAAGYYEFGPRSGTPPAESVALNVDLQHWMVFRSDAAGKPRPPLEFPRDRLDLKFTLPVGSEDGEYDLQVVSPQGGPALVSGHGTARLEDHNETLRAQLNVSPLTPGSYSLEIQRQGAGPLHVPIAIYSRHIR